VAVSHEGDTEAKQQQNRHANSGQNRQVQRTVQEKFSFRQLPEPGLGDIVFINLAEAPNPLRADGIEAIGGAKDLTGEARSGRPEGCPLRHRYATARVNRDLSSSPGPAA
jgi:hypothetical protein